VLEVPSLEAPNRKGEPKVSQQEGCTGRQDPLKDIIKVNSTAPNRDHGALREVCAKTGDEGMTPQLLILAYLVPAKEEARSKDT
jgi:hypothetical protein